jgi:hypothetical protein
VDGLLQKITVAQDALNRRKKERAELVAPDDKTLKAVRAAIKKRDDAQLRIEASLITLEVVPEKGGKLIVIAGEETGEVQLSPGVPTRVSGSPEVVADLPGVSRIRASGPAGSVEEHRAERAEAERELKRLTEPFGTSDIEALEALLEKGRALDKKIDEAETQKRSSGSVPRSRPSRPRWSRITLTGSRRHPNHRLSGLPRMTPGMHSWAR